MGDSGGGIGQRRPSPTNSGIGFLIERIRGNSKDLEIAGARANQKLVGGETLLLLYGLASETRAQHERGCLLLSANLQRDPRDATISEFLRDNHQINFLLQGRQERNNSPFLRHSVLQF